MKKIAVGASSFGRDGDAARLLAEHGYTVVANPYGRRLTAEETIVHLQDAVGLLAGLEPLNEAVLSACPELRAVARIGIGMDNVDVAAARKHNIKVSNTPDAPTSTVAEMTLAALLSILRQVIPANADMHKGVWKKRMGSSLFGLRVLLVGYGRIARRFAELLAPFGVTLSVSDPAYPNLAEGTFEQQLANADVISLHAAGAGQLIGPREFACVQDGAVLLNSARGALVDEAALIDALSTGKLSAYWADVFPEEPYSGALTKLDNAILTPHISTYTEQCRKAMELQAAQNLLKDLDA